VATLLVLDNLGNVTQSETYSGATYSAATILGQVSVVSGTRRAKSESSYDSRGRAYRSTIVVVQHIFTTVEVEKKIPNNEGHWRSK
jgi:hypothetical protein